MNSVELYNKLKNFWARPTFGGVMNGVYKEGIAGRRKVVVKYNRATIEYKCKWIASLPDKLNNGDKWVRLTYEEFCYALGLEMMP